MDPRLLSIHLEAQPRREAFRQARAQLQNAVGMHTLAGDLRPALQPPDLDLLTMAKGAEPVAGRPDQPIAWLLDRGKALPLFIGMNSIGRMPDNNLVLEDACVSRRSHRRLYCSVGLEIRTLQQASGEKA